MRLSVRRLVIGNLDRKRDPFRAVKDAFVDNHCGDYIAFAVFYEAMPRS
jgi:hypothetical protein